MDFQLHNPIADMKGPEFLAVYFLFSSFVMIAYKVGGALLDPSRSKPMPSVHGNADPYEISYLRGGERDVAITAAFNLIQRTFLFVQPISPASGKLDVVVQSPEAGDITRLNTVERHVYNAFAQPSPLVPVLREKKFMDEMTRLCEPLKKRLTDSGLLKAPETVRMAWLGLILCVLLIDGLGGYKLLVALAKGRHNIAFLTMGMVVVPLIFFAVGRPGRLNALGKGYLTEMRQTYAKWQEHPQPAMDANQSALMVSLFGTSVFAGMGYAYLTDVFPRPAARTGDSGSCGSSCGSSSCSGGSSCGGGGCGGCGGGD